MTTPMSSGTMGPSGPAGSGGSLDKVGRATHRLLPSSKGKHVCKTYGWRGQVRMHSSATGRYEGLGTVCAYPWCGAQQADPHCRCEKPGEALMERDSDAEGFAFGSWPYSLDVREVRDLVRTLNAYVKGRDTVRISYLMWHRAAAPRDPRTGAGYLDQLTNQMVERGLCCVVTLPFHLVLLVVPLLPRQAAGQSRWTRCNFPPCRLQALRWCRPFMVWMTCWLACRPGFRPTG
jgi:hypothetical protein